MKVVNLRLPDSLNKELGKASAKSGVPKNRIFNDAVAAALEGYDGHCDKPKYINTCVRLPGESYDAVRSMANEKYMTMNTSFIQILVEHLGVEPCHVAEEVIEE